MRTVVCIDWQDNALFIYVKGYLITKLANWVTAFDGFKTWHFCIFFSDNLHILITTENELKGHQCEIQSLFSENDEQQFEIAQLATQDEQQQIKINQLSSQNEQQQILLDEQKNKTNQLASQIEVQQVEIQTLITENTEQKLDIEQLTSQNEQQQILLDEFGSRLLDLETKRPGSVWFDAFRYVEFVFLLTIHSILAQVLLELAGIVLILIS